MTGIASSVYDEFKSTSKGGQMNQLKEIPFVYEGEDYKIKIIHKDNLINILSFKNNYPANRFRHQILVPKKIPIKKT